MQLRERAARGSSSKCIPKQKDDQLIGCIPLRSGSAPGKLNALAGRQTLLHNSGGRPRGSRASIVDAEAVVGVKALLASIQRDSHEAT